jgi:hypothetical protein
VHDRPLLRLLALIQRELGADDARAEIGGRDPTEAGAVWVRVSDERRIVVWFDEVPPDPGAVHQRLRSLIDAFMATAVTLDVSGSETWRGATSGFLQAELRKLSDHAGACVALVIDASSPVLWACSSSGDEPHWDVADLVELDGVRGRVHALGLDPATLLGAEPEAVRRALTAADADAELIEAAMASSGRARGAEPAEVWRDRLRMARAIADVRAGAGQLTTGRSRLSSSSAEFGYVARAFADAYWLILAYAGAFSDLRAEAALSRSLPRVERLVLALPPTDPPRGGGKVMRMPSKPPRSDLSR